MSRRRGLPRALDLALAALGLLITSPVLLLAAIAVSIGVVDGERHHPPTRGRVEKSDHAI